jgi:sugar lactone lactonase YvrE
MEMPMKRFRRQVNGYLLGLALVAPLVLTGCGGGGSLPGGVRLGETATLAGAGQSGNADGPVATARFNNPVNVEVLGNGDVIVADFDNDRVRRISNGTVTTLVNQANFQRPFGLAALGNRLFVTTDANDTGVNNATSGTLWEINIAARTATVVARNLGRPRGIVALNATQLVLSDVNQHDIRLINVNTGVITPLAGSRGNPGFVNGTGDAARFNRPYGVAITPEGNIIVADSGNHAIRVVTPAGVVTTLTGNGTPGFADGTLAQARFNGPQDVEVDSQGFIYVADNFNNRIRRIRNGTVETIAGDGAPGFADGAGSQTRFFGLEGIALSPDETRLIVADGNGGNDGQPFHRIRSVRVR